MRIILRALGLLSLLLSVNAAFADYTIPILFIRTADEDGLNASTLAEEDAKSAVDAANAVFARNGGDIQFVMDPANDFSVLVRNRTANHDCILPAGTTKDTIAAQKTKVSNTNTLCDTVAPNTIRAAMALECPGKLVIFSRGGSEYIRWNEDEHHYELLYASGGHYVGGKYHIAIGSHFSGTDLAHEIGHYLQLPHPFPGTTPKTVAEAEAMIKAYVLAGHPEADGLKVFDGDHFTDTPPDAAGSVFEDMYGVGTKCDVANPTVPLTVQFAKHKRTYTLAPDRSLVMSYFKGCPFDQHFSTQQYMRMRQALINGAVPLQGLQDGSGNGCTPRDPQFRCELQAPKNAAKSLTSKARYLANCYKLRRKPLPGEINQILHPADPATTTPIEQVKAQNPARAVLK